MTRSSEFSRKVIRAFLYRLNLLLRVNWIKTFYFNFKVFPFQIAKKLPVFIYGKIFLNELSGNIKINGPIRRRMIGIGQRFELAKKEKGISQLTIQGNLIFNGPMHIGKDILLFVAENATCEFGYMSALGSDVKIICSEKIQIGDWSGIAYESQIVDTNSHPMKNTLADKIYPMSGSIEIGHHNTIANRCSIMQNTKTPNYCVVASNSICNKDYTNLGNKILIGGTPAKIIKENYVRDYENEYDLLKQWKEVPKGM